MNKIQTVWLLLLSSTVLLSSGCSSKQEAPSVPATPAGITLPPQENLLLSTSPKTLLADPFSDGAVFQRGVPLQLKGWDAPGTVVVARLNEHEISATADAGTGEFLITIPPQEAGGPHTITVEGTEKHLLRDILFGDVYFCVGQSNMEWTLENSTDAGAMVAIPHDPMLRMFRVARRGAFSPEGSVRGGWQPDLPEERPGFSAVAWSAGRTFRELDSSVPVGIYEISLSGSAIEAWMPREAFEGSPLLEIISKRQPPATTNAEADANARLRFLTWLNQHLVRLEPAQPEAPHWSTVPLDDSWGTVELPGRWELALESNFDGIVWFRKEVSIPRDWAGGDFDLHLGMIDDWDQVFWNGIPIGRTLGDVEAPFSIHRRYRVPAEHVKEGVNTIAVRVTDYYSGGGIAGPASLMKIASTVNSAHQPQPLAGEWRWKVESILPLGIPPAPTQPGFPRPLTDTPSVLWNGMLAPLLPIRSSGVLWYQGESNAFSPNLYEQKWSSLQRSWRNNFQQPEWPFVIVQLPGFGENLNPVDIPWAEFRELQQNVTLEDSMTALICTIDLGDCKDVHPRNKVPVGERLALAAKQLQESGNQLFGPHFEKLTLNEDGSAFVEIKGAVGALQKVELVSKPEGRVPHTGFWASNGDGIFHPADFTPIGSKLLITCKAIPKIKEVRYAWANCPTPLVEDSRGFPLFPFRTDNFERSVMVGAEQ
ncbi:MAG: sialate O-acetylesterase [Candidatus Sumerlaeia bacterium]|nr:sialate O-acetylesterase [Candidatus Sumerlaeia bacterium]